MTKHIEYESSSLFLLRIWREQIDGGIEWCGDVRRTVSGEGHTFRGWQALETALQELLLEPVSDGDVTGTGTPGITSDYSDHSSSGS